MRDRCRHCGTPCDGPNRRREVGGGRSTRQPGQVRKEAALTRPGGSLSNLPPRHPHEEKRHRGEPCGRHAIFSTKIKVGLAEAHRDLGSMLDVTMFISAAARSSRQAAHRAGAATRLSGEPCRIPDPIKGRRPRFASISLDGRLTCAIRVATLGCMNDTIPSTHPYSLDVGPAPKPEAFFQWTIRKSGKVFQRSDRSFPSEAEARKKGAETIERILTGWDR